MKSLVIRSIALTLLLPLVIVAAAPASKRKVKGTYYGYPGGPHATRNTRLGLGDHNNILNKDSVAVSSDLNGVFPFGSTEVSSASDTTRPILSGAIPLRSMIPMGNGRKTSTAILMRRPKNDLTMRWSERRTGVRFTFEMTSTLPLRATRALVRRGSSCS